MDALCRDCHRLIAPQAKRCPHCMGRRIVRHDELLSLSIAHIDCDAFYAAVEKRDRPELRNKALIIGGVGGRGVVSTACYIARMHGVHSAMPMFKARKACPHAVIIPPNMAKYRDVSRAVRSHFDRLTPAVEPLSIDEAFLDLTGTQVLHGEPPAQQLNRLAHNIEADIGVTVSVGLSHNKFLAKLASDMDKPSGFSVIGQAETRQRLAGLKVTKIFGVGKSLQRSLQRDGITHIHHLQNIDPAILTKRYGAMGLRLAQLAVGDDRRQVTPGGVPKSISSERTLAKDISALEDLQKHVWRACEQVSGDLKRKDYAARTVTLKLKTSGHRIITRSRTLPEPTQMAGRLYEEIHPLLTALAGGAFYRLVGVGAANLTDPLFADGEDLASPERGRSKKVEDAMDALRAKFGQDAVQKGRSL